MMRKAVFLAVLAHAACGGESSTTPEGDPRDPPAAPEGFVVVGEDGGVILGWGYPSGTMQRGVHVYWGTDPEDLTEYFFVPSPRTRYQLGGLTNGQTYAFALTLEHATGLVSERTSTKLVVPRPSDLKPPRLVAIDPDPSSASLAPDAPITFELSEAMALATVTVDVVPERALARPKWDAGGRRLTITPSVPWEPGTNYRFSLAGEDLAGNTLTTTAAIEVTTGLDARAPTITGFSPHDGMAAVPIGARIAVSFDEGMDVESVVRAFEVHPSPGCTTTADVSRRTFTCTPSVPLTAGGVYGVLVRTTARSVAGVPLARESGITFTVAAEPATTIPTLVRAAPEDGAIGVARHFELVLTFDVAMDRAATEAALSFPSHPGLGGTFTWSAQGLALHFVPSVDPPHGAQVVWSLGTGAKSLGGVALASPASGALRVVRRERRAVEAMVGLGGTIAMPLTGDGAWVDEGTSLVELGRVERHTRDAPAEPATARGVLVFDLSTLPEDLTAVTFAELELEERHRAGACDEGMGWRIESIEGGPALVSGSFAAPVLATLVCTSPTDCVSVPLAITVTECPDGAEGWTSHAITELVAADWRARDAQSYLSTLRLRLTTEEGAARRIELLTAHPWVPERHRPRLVVEYEVP